MEVFEVTYRARFGSGWAPPVTARVRAADPDDAIGKVNEEGLRITRCVLVEEARR